jgi:ATP-dependent helicase HrpA
MVLRMHPGLEDAGTSVRQRLYTSETEARAASRRGIARLAALELSQTHGALRALLQRDREFALVVAAAGFGRPLLEELADRAVAQAVLGDVAPLPRTEAQFRRMLDAGRAHVHDLADGMRATVAATLLQIRAARSGADQLSGRGADTVRESIHAHLDRLFAPGWVRDTPAPWFSQLPKYAQAALRRTSLAASNRLRHDELEAQVALYDQRLRELDLRNPATAQGPAREQLRWMIEEFRISLYAQELRTLRPVSARRVDALVLAAAREAEGS